MHGQNIGDNQPIVVPTTQWNDQGYWSQHGNYHQMSSSAYQTTATSIPPMSNHPTTAASFNPYYQYNQQNSDVTPPIVQQKEITPVDEYTPKTYDLETEYLSSSSSNKENASFDFPIRTAEFYSAITRKQPVVNNPKLCYTPFQLDLLNMIYSKWKHPKADQKTFISKVVGITRKQTIIWFQNRRRRDQLVAEGKLPPNAAMSRPIKSKKHKSEKSQDDEEEASETSSSEMSPNSTSTSENNTKIEMKDTAWIFSELNKLKDGPSRESTKRVSIKRLRSESGSETSSSQLDRGVEKSPRETVQTTTELKSPIVVNNSAESSSSSDQVSSEEEAFKTTTPRYLHHLQHPLQINDFISHSYSNYPKYPKLYSTNTNEQEVSYQNYTTNWSGSQAINCYKGVESPSQYQANLSYPYDSSRFNSQAYYHQPTTTINQSNSTQLNYSASDAYHQSAYYYQQAYNNNSNNYFNYTN